MGGLGAIAIRVFSLVIMRFHRIAKVIFGILDAFRNLRQVRQLKRSAVSFDDFHQIDTIEKKFVVLYMKLLRWKVKSLLDQVNVSIHLPRGLTTRN